MIIHDACSFCKCQISINSLSGSQLFIRSHKAAQSSPLSGKANLNFQAMCRKGGEISPVRHFHPPNSILQFVIYILANQVFTAYHYTYTAHTCTRRGGVCMSDLANETKSICPAAAKKLPLYKEKEVTPAASSADKAAWIAFPAQCQRKERPAGAVRDTA